MQTKFRTAMVALTVTALITALTTPSSADTKDECKKQCELTYGAIAPGEHPAKGAPSAPNPPPINLTKPQIMRAMGQCKAKCDENK